MNGLSVSYRVQIRQMWSLFDVLVWPLAATCALGMVGSSLLRRCLVQNWRIVPFLSRAEALLALRRGSLHIDLP
jgi:hypothetical protein